jgi:hypothetical protein
MMNRVICVLLVLLVFSVSVEAQMCCGAKGEQKGDMPQSTMTVEGQQMPMMNCPKMQSQGMMHGSQQKPMKQEAMGEGQQMPMMCPKMQQMQGQGMMQGGPQMPMMQMCMPMMQHMMGQNLLAKDMMYMMTDIMKIQKKIISGVSPSEKKEMLKELDKMMDKMDRMMSDMRCSCKMMGGMMELPSEPAKEEQEKEKPMQKEVPKTDPHGH